MAGPRYDVFISYRRDSGHAEALAIRQMLTERGLRVFLDVSDLKKGYFDETLLTRIAETPNFLVVLSLDSLDRCADPEDWLRREIAQACKSNCNIITVMMSAFKFRRDLPEDIKSLPRFQGVEYSHIYHKAMVDRIMESIEAERAERERLEQERAEADRLRAEKQAEEKGLAQEQAEREAREAAETERRAKEEAAWLKAEAERRATKEGQARETVEGKGPASVEPGEREARVPPATPQRTLLKPQPLLEPKPAIPSLPSPQLRAIQKGKSPRVLAASLVAAAVVVIVAALAWVYWPKAASVQPKPGKSVPPKAGVRENAKDRLKYVWIPPGTFEIGCSPGDTECDAAEKPSHRVTLSKGFWIGQTEVTVGAYKRFAAATGRQMPAAPDFSHGQQMPLALDFNRGWANDSMPIVNVSWNDAQDYCAWAGGRLPTEAEWEYAARGGSAEPRYGNLDEIAWYRNNSGAQTREVAQKRANGFGLYDMLGNVWEWVNDRYDENYYQHGPSLDPSGPTSGEYRVARGGSWSDYPWRLRTSSRGRYRPDYRLDEVGFRCVREVDSP